MTTHQQLEARSLAMHRLVADKIRREPALYAAALATLRHWRVVVDSSAQPYLAEWERLFEQGLDDCLAVAVEDSERAAALRQCSPFPSVLNNQERFAFLQAWSREHAAQGP